MINFVCSLTLAVLFVLPLQTRASNGPGDPPTEKKQYFTQSLNGKEITLDGIPGEVAWEQVPWEGGFIQLQPNEGMDPSQETHFKVLYDEKFLYIAFRCLDEEPDKIEQRMGRRDEFPGDWIEINIDSYHDLRTAFSFTISVSGVRNDELVSNNGENWDSSWNPVWYAKTNVDDKGWTAEAKIPLSQLRYGDKDHHIWGIQITRRLFRKEERSIWQYIPRNSGVWVSGFGELHGLKGIPPQKQVEIAPYLLGSTENFEAEPGNPFSDGTTSGLSAGIDGKVAVTSDLILDFTVNPDFGQVEADPSAVRLDGFQNFFQERRPFFIESSNIFNYQITGSEAGGSYDSDLLFYSRRIGGSPHLNPELDDDEYADVPNNTSILAAAKFSGKTKDGWSVGILESITQREKAEIDLNGERRKVLVEPLASYFVGRVQKDIDEGNTVIGGVFTSVNREKGLDDLLHRNAYSGGFDFLHYWNNRTWYVKANGIFSRVEGTPEAIYNTQTSFEHLFQREDADHVEADPTRTSLTGHGGTIALARVGGNTGPKGQILKFQSGVTWRSPELELNDIGFMLTSDEINHFTWVGYHYIQPFSIFNALRFNYNHWSRWDFGGRNMYINFNVNANANFRNLWSAGMGGGLNPLDISNNALRGESALRKPPGGSLWFWVESNESKKLVVNYNQTIAGAFENRVRYRDYSLGIRMQPVDAMSFSLSAAYSRFFREQDQYVDQVEYQGQTRTIVSELNQKTVRLTARLNYNITPDLTIQYYGQPFITRPLFDQFGIVVDPMNRDYESRFHRFTSDEIQFEGDVYQVDENGDGEADYTFDEPDFNFVQFRSNLVLRWEYIPGSEVYLVWSQSNTPDALNDLDRGLGRSLYDNLLDTKAHNIFLVKLTYRFLL